ncbi:MAG: Arginine--tRNA ligase [Chlamydiales bacterium]|nr:Arginine--tRNA ligase [Chlamydiales bacterium]
MEFEPFCYRLREMKPLIETVEQAVTKAAYAAFPEVPVEELQMHLTPATQEKFGHYQCNSAMRLAKSLKKAPREIAGAIVEQLERALFEEVEIAGPGFINLTLRPQYLSTLVNEVVRDGKLGVEQPATPKRIIVEFSSPNIAKEMHVGHLRSTIIGDAIARLFEFLGHIVIRLNHVGDWGTSFGMLIAYIDEEIGKGLEEADLPTLMKWYRLSKERFDADEAFKTRARQAVVALQGGDPAALKAWETICHISRQAFQEVYDLLDIRLEERGESFYNPMLGEIVKDLEEKGLVTVSEGAKCVFHEGHRIPLMVQKSDGGYNYDTTDMAAMLHRIEDERAERIVVVTDAGQSLHFDLIRKTAEKAGYLDPKKVRFDHVPFGVVLGTDGKKFRTRSGEVEKLIDLLTASISEANKILAEREHEMSTEELERLARILGIDAVKYADLSCNRISDYVFSYQRMLRFEGNTAAFILYAFVRVNGIKRKIGKVDIKKLLKTEKVVLEHPTEIDLGLHLLRFSETLQVMEEELLPNVLTDYLYILAQKFNAFFRDCRVEGVQEQNSRLLLCEAVARTMGSGLQILGIQTVDRM